jgi:hypothetical protein
MTLVSRNGRLNSSIRVNSADLLVSYCLARGTKKRGSLGFRLGMGPIHNELGSPETGLGIWKFWDMSFRNKDQAGIATVILVSAFGAAQMGSTLRGTCLTLSLYRLRPTRLRDSLEAFSHCHLCCAQLQYMGTTQLLAGRSPRRSSRPQTPS